MGPKRIAAAPDLPTFAEALGLAGFEVTNSYGLFAPTGTPAPIVEGLNRIVLSGMRTPEVLRKVQSDGAEPADAGTPAELKVKFAHDHAEAEKQIKQLKIKFY